MRDIKTRETRAGSVKTIDRAALLGDKMKQATLRNKEQIGGFDHAGEQNETNYAEEKTFAIVDDSLSSVGHATVTGVTRGREFKKTRDKRKLAHIANITYQNGKKEYGNKAVPYEKVTNSESGLTKTASISYLNGKSKVGEKVENSRLFTEMVSGKDTGRVKVSFVPKTSKVTGLWESGKTTPLTSGLSREKAETVLKRQYQTRKAIESIRKKAKKTGKGFLAAVRKAVESSKSIVGSLSVAGSIALIAIIVCTFFGSTFYILGDESSSDFVPGGFEGIGNEAIVEVAAAQVGNKGFFSVSVSSETAGVSNVLGLNW